MASSSMASPPPPFASSRLSRLFSASTSTTPSGSTTHPSEDALSCSNNSFAHACSEPPSFASTPVSETAPGEPLSGPSIQSYPRASSPTPSMGGFSIIGSEEALSPSEFYGTRPSPSRAFSSLGRRAAMRSSPALDQFSSSPSSTTLGSAQSFKSLLPRLWDVLVSPSKSGISSTTFTGHRHTVYNFTTTLSSPQRKGKERAQYRNDMYSNGEYDGDINYVSLSPLDDDEGELIDDEACFVAVDFWGHGIEQYGRATAVTGMDIITLLPPELALQIFTMLTWTSDTRNILTPGEPEMTPTAVILACLLVSKDWRRLVSDNSVWRTLFISRFGKIDGKKMSEYVRYLERQHRKKQGLLVQAGGMSRRAMSMSGSDVLSLSLKVAKPSRGHTRMPGSASHPSFSKVPMIDWKTIFRERLEIEKRWTRTALASYPKAASGDTLSTSSTLAEKWDPTLQELTGHSDSVYCLEFTAEHVFTGSRDKTIRVWSLKTGRCLATFGRARHASEDGTKVTGHTGSVLCLKFFWDEQTEDDNINEKTALHKGKRSRKGVLFSGSSDCTICIWELECTPGSAPRRRPTGWGPNKDDAFDQPEYDVKAKVTSVLRGHGGGVLDLRVDENWIVSCSKDAAIRVWNRKTEELHRTLRGHEGPVNAVGLDGGKVVSASGDGKIILWDIASGERVRTLEGHDRGLACIEFKGDLIVSGSNDCKIKIWSATTGECIKTLIGHEALVRALAFDPKNGRLVSASYDKTVKVWDTATGRVVREFRDTHTSHIFDVKFDASKIVSCSHDQKVVVLDFAQGIQSASLFEL